MRPRKYTTGPILTCIFLTGALFFEINAQEISKADLEQRASANFKNNRYDKAAEDYETLYAMFPKDTKYAYYLGRSIFHANKDVARAADLLKFVATRNYGDDAYFYLGMAYLCNYQFDEATLAFTTFRKTASSRQLEKYDADYWVNVCSNAQRSATVARVLQIDNFQVVPENAIGSAFRENIDGKYIFIPEEFKSEQDVETDYQTVMFIPQSLSDGDYLYFDRQVKKGKQGSDIYRVQRITPENYSLPEALPAVINTCYDEAYPFFDKLTGTLYFSSKGHTSSGGFDIFKTQYDSANSTWKSPEKLDFPINTPYDDYLYTLTGDRKAAIFLTNRNTGLHEAEAYTVLTSDPVKYVSPANRDELLTYASLTPASIEINEVATVRNDTQENRADEPEPASKAIQPYTPTDEYARLIKEGLDYQSKSDSLNWSVKGMRSKAENESDFQRKQELIANLTTLDQESKRLQRMADEKFLLAEQARGTNGANNVKQETVLSKHVTSQEAITVYTYPQEQPSQPIKSISNEEYEKGLSAAKSASAELSFTFSINNSSPYSAKNPIPIAILPGGLIYRIQLGSFSNAIPENAFGGLSPVSKEKNSKETKYYVGNFSSVGKAREALEQVKKYGYPDAFIVSYYDSKRISIQKAREIEFANK